MRKSTQTQAGTLSEQNAPQPSYGSYEQGSYQNRSQTQSGSVTAPHQDYKLGQKDPNAMDVDYTQQ